MYNWNTRGPLTREVLDAVIAAVQERLDLLAVLRERYGQAVEEAGERWRCVCFLPSLVPGFAGSCAEQDASEHGGETPRNLWVSDGETTRVWRCHSCGRRGDVVDLIEHALPIEGQEQHRLRAVRLAAQLAGVAYLMDGRAPGPNDEPDDALTAVDVGTPAPRRPTATVDFDRARDLNYRAAKHWHETLHVSGDKARAELRRRNVTEAQIAAYQIGYASPRYTHRLLNTLPEHLHRDAAVLGLIEKSKRDDGHYDRYRDRIVWPYCEPARDGRPPSITGFAGRDLSNHDKAPKWLNANNTPGVWEKSSALLGLYQAHARLTQHDQPSPKRGGITEGIYDTLAFDRVIVPAVALVSAALTLAHCAVLVDVLGLDALTIAFDGDAAGRRNAITAATTALAFGFPPDAVTLIDPGDGKDPDDLAPADLYDRWSAPLSIIDFALRFGEFAPATARIALLAALPSDHGHEDLRRAWQIDADAIANYRSRATPASPAQQLARQLAARPDLAQHIARTEAEDALASDPIARRRVASLTFGEATDEQALPSDLRRAWLTVRLQREQTQLAEHGRTNPFAGGDSADAFRAWFAQSKALQSQVSRTQNSLAEL